MADQEAIGTPGRRSMMQNVIRASTPVRHHTAEGLESMTDNLTTSAPALAILDELYMRGKLTKEKTEKYKAHYLRMQAQAAKQKQRQITQEAKLSRKQNLMAAELRKIEQTEVGASKSAHISEMLKEQFAGSEHETTRCREREHYMEVLQKEVEETLAGMKTLRDKHHRNENDDRISHTNNLMLENDKLQAEIQRLQSKRQSLHQQNIEKSSRMKMLKEANVLLRSEVLKLETQVSEKAIGPESIREQIAKIDYQLNSCREKNLELSYKIRDLDHEKKRMATLKREILLTHSSKEDERLIMKGKCDSHDKQRDGFSSKQKQEKVKRRQLQDRLKDLELELEHGRIEVRTKEEQIDRTRTMYNSELKDVKLLEIRTIDAARSVPNLISSVADLKKQSAAFELQKATQKQRYDEVFMQMKIIVGDRLKGRDKEKELSSGFKEVDADIIQLEAKKA